MSDASTLHKIRDWFGFGSADHGHHGDSHHGREQQGRRPVLVVSPTAFNQLTQLPIIVPITTGGNFARTAGFAVSLTGTGTKTTGVVRCDQPRVLDVAARGGKKIERAPDMIVNEVLAKVSPLLE